MIVVVYNNDLDGAVKVWKKKMRQSQINSEIAFRERWPSRGERKKAKRHLSWLRRKRKDKRIRAKF